jgi:PAS domain S-box-containing protein
LIADNTGAIEWINRAFTAMTGYTFQEVNGINYLQFLRSTEDHSDFDDMWRTIMSGEVWHGELVNQHKNGSQIPVEQVVTPVFDDAGKISHIIAIKQNIAQRKTMELALKQSLQNYRQLSNHLETIREEERIRIAREIHDELGGFLTVLKIDLSLLSKQMPKELVDCHGKIEAMKQSIHQGLKTIKRIINDLRPSILDHLGLIPALEWLAENIIRRANLICIMKVFDQAIEVSPELNTAIFRVTQEAFINIVRHAKASHVILEIEFNENNLLITIKDNGCGITQEQMMKSGSFGIQGMRERIRYFGGDLTIESSSQIGTLLRINIPNVTYIEKGEV